MMIGAGLFIFFILCIYVLAQAAAELIVIAFAVILVAAFVIAIVNNINIDESYREGAIIVIIILTVLIFIAILIEGF